jgi:hypothetical protein
MEQQEPSGQVALLASGPHGPPGKAVTSELAPPVVADVEVVDDCTALPASLPEEPH